MAMTITIDGETYSIEHVTTSGGYLPHISTSRAGHGPEFYVARSSMEAGKAARKYWADMAENDKREFTAMVGEKALIAWALGEYGGPGSTQVTSLKKWLDLSLKVPEEQFASYDGQERTVEKVSSELRKALGFTPKVAYRHN